MYINILDNFSTIGGYFIPFLFVLTIVVFFHELGHFLVARLCGVRVLVFSIGFGPELFGFNDRHDTRWKFALIPLGGYVKFYGDENAASVPDYAAAATMSESERKKSFVHQSLGNRSAIVAAGPLANFVLAVMIFAAVYSVYGRQLSTPRVDSVQPNSAAAAAGFQPGDLVLSIDGRAIQSFSDLQRLVSVNAGRTLNVVVDRGGVQVTLKATPTLREMKDNFGNVHRIGVLGISRSVQPSDVRVEPVDPLTAVKLGIEETWFIIERTLSYVGGVIVGREAADQVGGPARIAQVAGQVWQGSVSHGGVGQAAIALFQLAAVLSVSIGLINLFPVPLLDGGHLLFYAIEAIRGRPLSEQAQEIGFRIGLAIVVMLMIFATYNDILHFAGS
ncbi:MAG TPA: RIP metalloprotease RseP [Xanthobacteraceae bacterium]|nr:RIP metalloprotease RseP [Xanthobacteraceae bacterium]